MSISPDFAFMRPRLSRWIAFGFGSGLAPFSPGTVGSLWGWASYLLINAFVVRAIGSPVWAWPLILVLALVIGIWACGRCGRDMGISDHGAMVWDEVVAIWLILWLIDAPLRAGFSTQLGVFLLFRFFDILKPPPIGQLDASLKGGWGVMADDLLAAFYTLLALALWRAL